jgi:hypothetical protein
MVDFRLRKKDPRSGLRLVKFAITPVRQPMAACKHDGFRIIAHKNSAQVRVYSRPGNDLTRRFPLIVETLARLWSRLRHGCGHALAKAGHDTRAPQAWLGTRTSSIPCGGSRTSGAIRQRKMPRLPRSSAPRIGPSSARCGQTGPLALRQLLMIQRVRLLKREDSLRFLPSLVARRFLAIVQHEKLKI